MPQEFHVVRCYACKVFQVHQVKKIPKWSCKMCGEKQSLMKVYGCGSGSDCRRHVQKLNMLTGESSNLGRDVLESVPGYGYNLQCREFNDEYQAASEETGDCVFEKPQVEKGPSKWHAFIDSDSIEEISWRSLQEDSSYHHLDNAEMTWNRPDYHRRGKGKYCEMKARRKRKRDDLDQDTNVKSCNLPALHQDKNLLAKGFKTCTSGIQDQKNILPDSQYLVTNLPVPSRQFTNHEETDSFLATKSGFGQRLNCIMNVENGTPTSGKVQRSGEVTHGSSNKWGQFLQDYSDDNDDVVKGKIGFHEAQIKTSIESSTGSIGGHSLESCSTSQSGFSTTSRSTRDRSNGNITAITQKSWQEILPQKDSDVGLPSQSIYETLGREEHLKTDSNLQGGSEKDLFSLEDEDILNEVLKDDW